MYQKFFLLVRCKGGQLRRLIIPRFFWDRCFCALWVLESDHPSLNFVVVHGFHLFSCSSVFLILRYPEFEKNFLNFRMGYPRIIKHQLQVNKGKEWFTAKFNKGCCADKHINLAELQNSRGAKASRKKRNITNVTFIGVVSQNTRKPVTVDSQTVTIGDQHRLRRTKETREEELRFTSRLQEGKILGGSK